MLNRIFFLSFVITITFAGGFFTGKIFTEKRIPMTESEPFIVDEEQNVKAVEEKTEESEHKNTKALMAYIQDFRDPEQINYDELTHIIFSFAHPTTDGDILLSGETAMNNLRTIISKAHEANTKVLLAVGGWSHLYGGESYDYFQAAISDPVSREKLADSLTDFAEQEHLDGVDIDFEHPRSLNDANNLEDFTKELRERLHPKGMELSIAVHSKINAFTLTESNYVIYQPSTFKYVDHVNIMAYDGQWDEGYHAENLSSYAFTEKVVTYWRTLFEQNNLSTEKLILGVPFYAQPEDSSVKQVSYAAIIEDNPENAYYDTVNYNGTTYYYNGSDTMKRKTKLALEEDFGGIMVWEAGLDATGPNSLTSVIYKELFKSS